MYHHGPCIWRIASFHPSQKGQEGSGVLGHPVVWPGRELELPHLSLLTGAILNYGFGERLVTNTVHIKYLTDVVGSK